MKSSTERFIYDLATRDDNPQLAEIINQLNFKGSISLQYSRDPDVYGSFLKEGEKVKVMVLRDLKENKIAGFGAFGINSLYVNGKPEKTAYIFSLRVNQKYNRFIFKLRGGYAFMFKMLQKMGIKYYYTTILQSNDPVKAFLEKGYKQMPRYQNRGDYFVFSLKCENRKIKPRKGLVFRKAGIEDMDSLLAFLNREGSQYHFFPHLTKEDFTGKKRRLSITDFCIVTKGAGKIVAAGAAWDQRAYKQYRVLGYNGMFKFIKPFSGLLPLFGYPPLPEKDSLFNFFTLSFWCIKDNDRSVFSYFIKGFRRMYPGYSFLSVGMHESHPLKKELTKKRHICYKSHFYLVYPYKAPGSYNKFNRDKSLYIECGRL